MKRRLLLALLIFPGLAFAHSSKFGDIAIGHSWSLPSQNSEIEVMMPLLNMGLSEESIISATSPIASKIELRDGTETVSEFKLDPNKPFAMRGPAKHLHLLGLAKPLVKGDIFPMTLKFKNAGEFEIKIHVNDRAGE